MWVDRKPTKETNNTEMKALIKLEKETARENVKKDSQVFRKPRARNVQSPGNADPT